MTYFYVTAIYDFAESVWCAVIIRLHAFVRQSQDMFIKICSINSLYRNGTLYCNAVLWVTDTHRTFLHELGKQATLRVKYPA